MRFSQKQQPNKLEISSQNLRVSRHSVFMVHRQLIPSWQRRPQGPGFGVRVVLPVVDDSDEEYRVGNEGDRAQRDLDGPPPGFRKHQLLMPLVEIGVALGRDPGGVSVGHVSSLKTKKKEKFIT